MALYRPQYCSYQHISNDFYYKINVDELSVITAQ